MFWERTPRQIIADLKGGAEKLQREQNERMSLAWHTALLHRIEAKRFPKLKQLLAGQTHRPPEQSWQDQLAAVSAWVSARGR